MRTIGKSIRAAHAEHRSWKQEMYSFLRNYRATPHTTTDKSPAEIFIGRSIRTKIPEIRRKINSPEIRNKDKKSKYKMKVYADTHRHAKKSSLRIGDSVLVKQEKKDKLTTPFDPKPFTIKEQKGTMVTAERDDKIITRNSSHFKMIPCKQPQPQREENDNKLDDDNDNDQNKLPLRRSSRGKLPPNYLKDYIK